MQGSRLLSVVLWNKIAEKAYHLIDHVLPDAPYCQWVLSLPIPLRFWIAIHKKLTSKVHQTASKEINAYYASIAKSKGIENPRPGSIPFIQRFGSACNLNTRFHLVALEGVYVQPPSEEAIPRLMAFEQPTDQEVCDVVEKIATKTIKLLRKKGYLQEEGEAVLRPDLDQLFQDHPSMTEAMAASIQSKIAFGERSGEKVKNHRWAKRLARPFKVDVGTCPKCGSLSLASSADTMEIMGAVQDPGEVQRYLRHIDMREYPPPIAPVRDVQAELAYDDCAYEDTFTE